MARAPSSVTRRLRRLLPRALAGLTTAAVVTLGAPCPAQAQTAEAPAPFRPLTGSGTALRSWSEAACRGPQRPVVVMQYGDSHTDASFMTRALLEELSPDQEFHSGFIPVTGNSIGGGKTKLSNRWKAYNWLFHTKQGPFGPHGKAAVLLGAPADLTVSLERPVPRGTTFTVLYEQRPDHAPFFLWADDAPVAPPTDPEPTGKLGHRKFELPEGARSLRLTVTSAGPLRLYGFLLQVPGSFVELDSLGVGGAMTVHPNLYGDQAIEEYLALRQPDLVLTWMGSNDAVDPRGTPERYARFFGGLIQRLKVGAPDASVVALGLLDLARRRKGCGKSPGRSVCEPASFEPPPEEGDCFPRTLPTVAMINDVQRQLSAQLDVGYLDTYTWMGGPGSIHRWACEEPALALPDRIHLTVAGYRRYAALVAEELRGKLRCAIGDGAMVNNAGIGRRPQKQLDEEPCVPGAEAMSREEAEFLGLKAIPRCE